MLKSKERLIDIKIEVVASSIYIMYIVRYISSTIYIMYIVRYIWSTIYIMYIVRYIWSTKAGFGVCWIELPQAPILVVYISK